MTDKTYEPVVLKATGVEPEKLHLFSIVDDEGDEVKYFIPKKVPYNLTLAAMEVAATSGDLAALVFALKEVLGEDGYNALLDFDELTEEDFEAISAIISEKVMGPGKGKANRAGRRALQRSRG